MAAIPRLGQCMIPALGFGVSELRGAECTEAVRCALETGFRLLDTAGVCPNEEYVGEGIHQSGVSRADIFVIVKVAPKKFVSEEAVQAAVMSSIDKLGIGYADLVLLHWPGCGGLRPDDAPGNSAARLRAYGALRMLRARGRARWIGVSNFLPRHFTEVCASCGHVGSRADGERDYPVVNQIELHPLCVQADVVAHCRANAIVPQQYAPLGQGKPVLCANESLRAIVAVHFPQHSVMEVLVMWGLAQGFSTLVRSKSAAHIEANWAVGNCFFAPEEEGGLCAEQHKVLMNLRDLMGVAEKPDLHLCWFSSEVA